MFNGSNCDRKSELPEILTEPWLSPRGPTQTYSLLCRKSK